MLVDARTVRTYFPPLAVLRNSLHLGKVTLVLCGASPEEIQIHEQLAPFVDNTRPADIEVMAEFVEDLHSHSMPCRFDSGAVWRVFSSGQGLMFDFMSDVVGTHPYKRMVVNEDFSSVRLLLNRSVLADHEPIFPLEYPADELLITNYLAKHSLGVEVHGCGLIDSIAGGQLFLGHSGAGKSTTTRIWRTARQPVILSDDRLILRLDGGELRMFGTPWHGEAAFAEQGNAPINRIFILQHGSSNRITRMPKPLAVGEVFARCFPPFHSAEGVEHTLEFISRMLDAVPCYEFHFVPNESAIQPVLDFHD